MLLGYGDFAGDLTSWVCIGRAQASVTMTADSVSAAVGKLLRFIAVLLRWDRAGSISCDFFWISVEEYIDINII